MKIAIFLFGALLATPAFAQLADTADLNHDGRITRTEFATARLRNFDRLDRNGDGVISAADLPAFARSRPRLQQAFRDFMAAADANHDGQVTRDELAKAPLTAFDRGDTNHDGVIDATEMAAFRAEIQRMRG